MDFEIFAQNSFGKKCLQSWHFCSVLNPYWTAVHSGECNGRVFLFYCALELFLQIKFYSFSENSFCIKIFLYESKNSEVLQSVLKSDYISVSTGSFEPG